jgi:hypothetical protein
MFGKRLQRDVLTAQGRSHGHHTWYRGAKLVLSWACLPGRRPRAPTMLLLLLHISLISSDRYFCSLVAEPLPARSAAGYNLGHFRWVFKD